MTRDWLDVKYDKKYRDEIKTISEKLAPHGSLEDDRRATIQLINIYCDMAQELTDEDLFKGGGGAHIGGDLCMLLAIRWPHTRPDIQPDYWITEKDEPLLFEASIITADLDVDYNQPDKWARLFEIAREL